MGTDLGALYCTFTKINSNFSIIFEMRRPRTLHKRTFVVEVNCSLEVDKRIDLSTVVFYVNFKFIGLPSIAIYIYFPKKLAGN